MGFQLPLDFRLRDEATFERFHVGANDELTNALQSLVEKPSPQMLYLTGSPGSGKSHLLQAVTRGLDSVMFLPLREIQNLGTNVFEGLETFNAVCLDDIDCLAGDDALELALFSLIKQCKDHNHILIMTARLPVDEAGFKLPDLQSRLNGCLTYHVQTLSDDNKRQFLIHDAHRRGLEMPEEVVDWILNHLPRDMEQLVNTMNRLDTESLRAQRRITIPFIKDLLESASKDDNA